MRLRTVILPFTLLTLACAGGADVGDPNEGRDLLLFEPGDECMWRLVNPQGGRLVWASSPVCPTEAVFAPKGDFVVALAPGKAMWGALGALAPLLTAEAPADASTIWAVKAAPMLGGLDYTGESPRVVSWKLDGAAFVPGPSRAAPEAELMMGDPLASPPEATPEAGWFSTRAALNENPAKQGGGDPVTEAARGILLARNEGDEIATLRVGGHFLAFRVVMGDTPHAAPPAIWCEDPTCGKPVPLTGALPDTFAAFPDGDRLLITGEYDGAAPTIYRAGEPAPIYTPPPGSWGIWAPGGW